ncbi:hypothetical protein KGQ19_12630 [Catenulispora sp. NL8]|uniref:SAF domain-containing protein n=1 Tax=Catenulispora pinistramenti TaxID=2705254 RepID=A0ABS5KNS7_9ACTN|nr:SAF domain-containing protein [Catenulispora pinistramenti]MBS2547713.1 hypothetical protein [Catenulispora pinistramenti]
MADTTFYPNAATGPVIPAAAPRAVPPRRRRPGIIALSVALILAGALGGVQLYNSVGHTYEVLAVAKAVPVGGMISADDLTTVRISLDPGIKPVSDAGLVVGKRAAVGLVPGTLITRGEVTDAQLIGAGQVQVGIATTVNQRPATPLNPGQKVTLIGIPDSSGGGPTLSAPVSGTVVLVGPADSQQTVVVDVAISADLAPQVEPVAGQGKVGIVLDGSGS